ncbi:MAG TPA: N-acetyl-1-D-myo-inositol-2-amino-2-deoxy-alpha-D-glucopyranoside deacetylase [Microlunatus sp.]|nr:N-acetyl-1-D-myo-inositol-2-amino-2-deoxy-alpha-D-glucopyranoside deacetylase [Microlunatus sp.]
MSEASSSVAEQGEYDRRLMLVHAHPDDECLNNGATMARYVDDGAQVTLVTCTLGEEGEVLVPDLEHLAAEHTDALGLHRLSELTAAMGILGVTDYVRLGGDGCYRDSGMTYDDRGHAVARDVLRPGIFWTADLLEAANHLVPLIRDRRPQVLITYNEHGNYGHPDHIQAHRVAMYGYLLAGATSYRLDLGEPWRVDRVLWTTMSRSRALAQAENAAGTEYENWGQAIQKGGPMESAFADDDEIAVGIDGTRWVRRKLDALRAHATQVNTQMFSLSDQLGEAVWSHEYYRLAAGAPFPAADGFAHDLFDGLV